MMMQPTYQPKDIEQTIYKHWEEKGYFKPKGTGKPYCIMLPPPNVTGSLHMGHGFQYALMDALIRYHRMRGLNTLWQPGIDHAGIATQMVVERQLLQQGKTRETLGRKAFVEKIWEWKEKSGGRIEHQARRLGISTDWSRLKFTMDEDLSKAVRHAFIQLYDEGTIYRGKRLVNWDPILLTAISDLEVINQEEKAFLWYIRYPLTDGSDTLIIATTRPETMLGDTAVAVHPEDERYKKFIGKTIRLPLTDREIPIIADEYVDPSFGTGCVKITPAHDFNDYAVGLRHNLPLVNIFTRDAHLNENAPNAYQGLDRFEAREKIIKDLQSQGLLERTEDHTLKIPRCDRTKTVIEPFLTDQWFVKTEQLAKPAIEIVEKREIRFIPENWAKTYFQWMNNIEDWCISRQLWWGHRIPAWYDEKNNIYVGFDEQAVREKYDLSNTLSLTQDEDVLDTWFSSALWPFSTLGWPKHTKELEAFYPTDVLVTAFDIIFFWVARMIMFGLKFMHQVPFKEVYITGLIKDPEGQKMSKSKGNTLDPLDLIDGINLEQLISKRTTGLMKPEMAVKIAKRTQEEFPNGIPDFGTDALRFTFCAFASSNRDIKFSLQRLEGYRNFCNKLWNATRYVLNQGKTNEHTQPHHIVDRWILSRLQKTIEKVHEYFSTYRFDLLAQELYEFTWHEFCDWYIELSKTIITDKLFETEKQNTINNLISVLEVLLRLLHPCIPFITEALWQSLTDQPEKTIMLQPYPESYSNLIDTAAENDIEWLKNVVLAIRNIRGEMNISPAKRLSLFLNKGTEKDQKRLEKYAPFLTNLAKLKTITWLEKKEDLKDTATALVDELEIFIPLTDLIDKQAEIYRLQKEIEKLETDLKRSESKLNNPNFTDNAPLNIVEKERQRVQNAKSALKKLREKIETLNRFSN
jgi:valyl-tRNA synthetase